MEDGAPRPPPARPLASPPLPFPQFTPPVSSSPSPAWDRVAAPPPPPPAEPVRQTRSPAAHRLHAGKVRAAGEALPQYRRRSRVAPPSSAGGAGRRLAGWARRTGHQDGGGQPAARPPQRWHPQRRHARCSAFPPQHQERPRPSPARFLPRSQAQRLSQTERLRCGNGTSSEASPSCRAEAMPRPGRCAGGWPAAARRLRRPGTPEVHLQPGPPAVRRSPGPPAVRRRAALARRPPVAGRYRRGGRVRQSGEGRAARLRWTRGWRQRRRRARARPGAVGPPAAAAGASPALDQLEWPPAAAQALPGRWRGASRPAP
eukprot:scaffold16982_cov94-Isochrysis_galbana.AAC.1